MTKLWKTTVNSYGWNNTATLYATSREEAEEIYNSFPAADPVEYAGNFADEKAKELLEYTARFTTD